MEGDCNVYAHFSLWMRPTRPDRYNMRMVYLTDNRLSRKEYDMQLIITIIFVTHVQKDIEIWTLIKWLLTKYLIFHKIAPNF